MSFTVNRRYSMGGIRKKRRSWPLVLDGIRWSLIGVTLDGYGGWPGHLETRHLVRTRLYDSSHGVWISRGTLSNRPIRRWRFTNDVGQNRRDPVKPHTASGTWVAILCGCLCIVSGCESEPQSNARASDAEALRGVMVDAEGLHDDPDATGQTCRLNSDCLPQLFCDDGRCTFECREDRDCASNLCISGECRPSPLSPPDTGGQDAGPIGGCRMDQDCPGIARICDQGVCTPDCTETGCSEGETCSSMTGRCVAEPPTSSIVK